jgi:hypothetical protein
MAIAGTRWTRRAAKISCHPGISRPSQVPYSPRPGLERVTQLGGCGRARMEERPALTADQEIAVKIALRCCKSSAP